MDSFKALVFVLVLLVNILIICIFLMFSYIKKIKYGKDLLVEYWKCQHRAVSDELRSVREGCSYDRKIRRK